MTKFSFNQEYPKAAKPIDSEGYDANGRIGLDTMRRVTRDEALELMCHHISLARMFYEATPKDEEAVMVESTRILHSGIPGYDGVDVIAVRSFLTAMNKFYSDLKKELGE